MDLRRSCEEHMVLKSTVENLKCQMCENNLVVHCVAFCYYFILDFYLPFSFPQVIPDSARSLNRSLGSLVVYWLVVRWTYNQQVASYTSGPMLAGLVVGWVT